MQKKNASLGEIFFLTAGEMIVSLVVIGVFYLIGKFEWRIVTGVLIGSFVTVLNFTLLSCSLSCAWKRVMAERGTKEMSEEEAEEFAKKHTAEIQASVKSSYLLRQILSLGILVAALVLNIANVIAAVIPLLCFRPILMVREAFRKKQT